MGNISKIIQNKSLWDVHCHILPGVDDGSRNMDMSMNMLKIAYDDNIRNIILTPHHHRRYENISIIEKIRIFSNLKEKAEDMFPDLKLYLGSEVFFGEDTIDELSCGKIISMASSKYILLEFQISVHFSYIKKAVDAILRADRLPIIAHVERYSCLMENIDRVDELREMGAYIQVNSSSISNKNFKVKKCLGKLFKWELVDFVASDAHDSKIRVPSLQKSYIHIAKKIGIAYADKIFIENPSSIIAGLIIGV